MLLGGLGQGVGVGKAGCWAPWVRGVGFCLFLAPHLGPLPTHQQALVQHPQPGHSFLPPTPRSVGPGSVQGACQPRGFWILGPWAWGHMADGWT